MDPHNPSRQETVSEILDEWSDSHPWIAPILNDTWPMMAARRMAKLPLEKEARRLYYDLYEFKCR